MGRVNESSSLGGVDSPDYDVYGNREFSMTSSLLDSDGKRLTVKQFERDRRVEDRLMIEYAQKMRKFATWNFFSFFGSFMLSASYVFHDSRRRKRSLLIGTTTVFVVVVVLTTLQSTLSLLPHVFLKVAEDEVGEMDFLWTPNPTNSSSNSILLNYTNINNRIRRSQDVMDELAGISPRWYIPATCRKNLEDPLPPITPDASPRYKIDIPTIILGIFGPNERNIGAGRNNPASWNALGEYEAVVSEAVALTLGIDVGDKFMFHFSIETLQRFVGSITPDALEGSSTSVGGIDFGLLDLTSFDGGNFTVDVTEQVITSLNNTLDGVFDVDRAFVSLTFNFTDNETVIIEPTITIEGTFPATGQNISVTTTAAPIEIAAVIDIEYSVKAIAEKPSGKWPNTLGNVVIAEAETLPHVAAVALQDFLNTITREVVFTINPADVLAQSNISLTGNLSTLINALNLTDLINNATAQNLTFITVNASQIATFFGIPGVDPSTTFNISLAALNLTALNNTLLLQNLTIDDLIQSVNNSVNITVDIGPVLDSNVGPLVDTVESFPIAEFAMVVIGMVDAKLRMNYYLSSPKNLKKDVFRVSNLIMEQLMWWTDSLVKPPDVESNPDGIRDPVALSVLAPLYLALQASSVLRDFIDMVFFGVYIMLIVLSCFVIYALLLDDVETKTFEYGMLRALGLPHRTLALVLLLQSLVFSIPGTIFGVALAWGIVVLIFYIATLFTFTPIVLVVPASAWGAAVAVGLIMPVLANIVPIRYALQTTLRSSLDIYHGATQRSDETSVTITKLNSVGINPGQTIGSIILVACGMIVYYMIPYAFIFGDTQLLLRIMTIILLMMVVGLSAVFLSIHQPISRIIPWITLWAWERRIRILVSNNLFAHRGRNIKTAALFMLALSYILFMSTMFLLQSNSIRTTVRLLSGSDLILIQPSPKGEDGLIGLPSADMRDYLNSEPRIESYSFMTFSMAGLPYVQTTRLTNLVGFSSPRVAVYGLESSYGSTGYEEYVRVTQVSKSIDVPETNGVDDPVRSLYVNQGKIRLSGVSPGYVPDIVPSPPYPSSEGDDDFDASVSTSAVQADLEETYTGYVDLVMSESFVSSGIADVENPLRLKVTAVDLENSKRELFAIGAAHATVSKMPGFFFSSYGIAVFGSPVILSIESWGDLLNESLALLDYSDKLPAGWPSPDVVPMQRLFIRLKDDRKSAEDRRVVSNGVLTFTDDDVTVADTKRNLQTADFASTMLQYFFNVVAALSILLGAFSLWLSFTANVRENSWEYAVLRSVGVSGFKLTRTSAYEALILTSVALVLGTIIGITIAITLTLQFNLFLENKFTFDFPYIVFFTAVALVFIVSLIGSILPSYQLYRRGITSVLKGGS